MVTVFAAGFREGARGSALAAGAIDCLGKLAATATGFFAAVTAARVPDALANGFFGIVILFEVYVRISRQIACGVPSREQGKRGVS